MIPATVFKFAYWLLTATMVTGRRYTCTSPGRDVITETEVREYCAAQHEGGVPVQYVPVRNLNELDLVHEAHSSTAVLHVRVRRVYVKYVTWSGCYGDNCQRCELTGLLNFLELDVICLLGTSHGGQCSEAPASITLESECKYSPAIRERSEYVIIANAASFDTPVTSQCDLLSNLSIGYLLPSSEELLMRIVAVCGLQKPRPPPASRLTCPTVLVDSTDCVRAVRSAGPPVLGLSRWVALYWAMQSVVMASCVPGYCKSGSWMCGG